MTPRTPLFLVLTACCLAFAGCGGSDDGDEPGPFSSGNFQFYNLAVDDQCVGGALNVLFMPEGNDKEARFAEVILIPAVAELPKTYTIPLQDPFHDALITLEKAGDKTLRVRNAPNPAVVLGEATWGDCTGDMAIDIDATIVDNDTLQGTATIRLSNLQSSGDTCFELDAEHCTIGLDIRAERVQ